MGERVETYRAMRRRECEMLTIVDVGEGGNSGEERNSSHFLFLMCERERECVKKMELVYGFCEGYSCGFCVI